MSVRVVLIGRLGNNLFQYAVGRIIAEHHGLELGCVQLGMLKTDIGSSLALTGPATLQTLTASFPGAPMRLPGRRIDGPVEKFEMSNKSSWGGNTFDFGAVMSDRTPRQIRLAGLFQRVEYFLPYADKIRTWFKVAEPGTTIIPGDNDILLNFRRGPDFDTLGWTVPWSYYQSALDRLSRFERVYVCGAGLDAELRSRLEPYAPVYLEGPPIEQLACFGRFRRLVLSNSTFAWWGAFLSQADEIYAPRFAAPEPYAFSGHKDVDLAMREPRYREIPVTC